MGKITQVISPAAEIEEPVSDDPLQSDEDEVEVEPREIPIYLQATAIANSVLGNVEPGSPWAKVQALLQT